MSTHAPSPDAPGTAPTSTRRRWRDRDRPLLVPWLTAASALASFQALFLVWRFQSLGGGAEMWIGVTKFAIVAGFMTAVLLLPVMMLLRRLHPWWKNADRAGASAATALGLVGALAGWLVADHRLAPLPLPPWLSTLLALGAGLISGLAVAALRLPRAWLRIGIVAAPVLLVFLFLPLPASSRARAREEPSAAPPPPSPPVATGSARYPDVVLVTVDTLRADRVGAYRSRPSITPEIDRFFREGVTFENVVTASPWTLPSVASIHTGLPTLRHGAGLPLGAGQTFRRSPLALRHTTLAERFAAAGYLTRAVVANGFAGRSFGMNQGFEDFSSPLESAMGAAMMGDLPLPRLIVTLTPKTAWGDYRASGVTDRAIGWLKEDAKAPLFLWVHYLEPHSPFQADPDRLDLATLAAMAEQKQPPVLPDGTVVGEVFVATDLVRSGTLWLGPTDRLRIEEYYDRAVGYVDRHVGRLFAALRERSRRRPVVAAFTADHGEELWDHGHFEHGHDYYPEITRAPLAFWGEHVPQSRTVAVLAGIVDVGPTLLELAGLDAPVPQAPDEGRSLVSSWESDRGGSRAATPPRFAEGNLYGLPAVLVADAGWRFLLRANGVQELYHVTDDPGEWHNVAFDHPERVSLYREMLEPRLDAILRNGDGAGPGSISVETLQSLRALGYVR
jgi:arylsulfatase A-like enzyme